MFYSTTIQTYIQEGTAFEIDGVQYPANWLNLSTPEEKLAIGLEEVIATNQPANQQFYWVSETLNQAELTYVNTPKDFTPCQEQLVSQTKQTAYTILFPTDWMVVKAFETNTPIPENWNTWRETIRIQAKEYVAQINLCTTVEELAALPSVQWANDPNYVPPIADNAVNNSVGEAAVEGATNDPV
jgi:hypothetical protein